ncbi:MAG: zf-HC2 domain-containing protein [Sphingomicrobium sp.]
MLGPNLTERKPHDEAEELLPWYANGQLDEADRARVDAHLSSCAYCRQQLALELRFIDEFQEMTPEVESGWGRLRARIEAPVPVRPKNRSAFAEFWASLSRPAVAGFVVAQLAFVIVAGWTLISLSRPDYHTLSSASAPTSAAANVIVIFRADATEEDVRAVLKAAGASIVGGPTAANAYLLHVAPGQRQMVLGKLQSDDNVQMAEPIDGAGS